MQGSGEPTPKSTEKAESQGKVLRQSKEVCLVRREGLPKKGELPRQVSSINNAYGRRRGRKLLELKPCLEFNSTQPLVY